MSEIIPNNPLEHLHKLAERELEVLQGFCAGNTYREIGANIHIAEGTVKTYMGNVYMKLGLNYLPPAQRRRILLQDVCLELGKIEIKPQPPNQKFEMIEVPPEVEKMVEEDERALLAIDQPEIIHLDPIPIRDLKPRRRLPCSWIMIVGLTGILLGIALVIYILSQTSIPFPLLPVPTTEVEIRNTDAIEEPTESIVEETQDMKASAATMEPNPLLVPSGFVFEDDFEDGIDKDDWFLTEGLGMAKGRLTIIDPEGYERGEPYWALVKNHVWGDVSINAMFLRYTYDVIVVIKYMPDGDSLGMRYDGHGSYVELGLSTKSGEWKPYAGTKSSWLESNSPNFRIDLVGEIIRVYLGGENDPVSTLQIPDPQFGDAPVGIFFTASQSKVVIEHFRVESLDNLPR